MEAGDSSRMEAPMKPTPADPLLTNRRYLVADDEGREFAREVSWADLDEVNDPETMDEIALIELGGGA